MFINVCGLKSLREESRGIINRACGDNIKNEFWKNNLRMWGIGWSYSSKNLIIGYYENIQGKFLLSGIWIINGE
jgi:hypothetical protein